ATHECSVICGPIGCAVDFVCRLLHLKIISLKKPLQIGLCNKAIINNKTSEDITKVNLTYKTTNKSENIGNLSPNQSFKYPIKYSDTEDSIVITYTDSNNTVHKDVAVPYFGKYDKKNYSYNIK
ncbi:MULTISPECIES: hypothetical protein, partial [unclassified Acinetobacter]|uniref:hypothetical protein n=1 Tax=unclassified Acinetobacter TaxID=196816 RepID=UPI001C55298B